VAPPPVGPPPAAKQRPLPPEDEFTEISTSIDRLTVDGSDLAAINQYLAGLAQMTKIVQSKAKTADAEAQFGDPGQTRYATLSHNEVDGVIAISNRLLGTEMALNKSLMRFAEALEHTATAITRIAKDYHDMDKLNKLNVEQVRQYLK
jgi:hypothetical protein